MWLCTELVLQLQVVVVGGAAEEFAQFEGGDNGAEEGGGVGEAVTHRGRDGGNGVVEEIVKDVEEGGGNDAGAEEDGNFFTEIVTHSP